MIERPQTPPDPPAPPKSRSVLLALSWYDLRVHRGVSRYAAANGWRLDTRMANSREVVWGWRGDGVLCKLGCATVDKEVAALVNSLSLPTVDLSVFGPEYGYPALEFDPAEIGELALNHLVERGIRNFGFFPDLPNKPVEMRRDAFGAAAAARGAKLHPIAPVPPSEQPGGWVNVEEELGRRIAALPKPVGILCFNDSWGAQLIHALERVGLRCPEDVAVLGVDNDALACEALPVGLSSVALDLEAWGERAAARLDAAMDAKDAGQAPPSADLERFPAATVVVRRSTDVVAVEHPDVAIAVEYIAEHLAAPVTVEAVVANGRLSRSGLKQAFSRHLGRSIQGEIERERADRIRRFLLTSDLAIDSIATRVGLASARSLHRLFARNAECTPAEFRRRYRG